MSCHPSCYSDYLYLIIQKYIIPHTSYLSAFASDTINTTFVIVYVSRIIVLLFSLFPNEILPLLEASSHLFSSLPCILSPSFSVATLDSPLSYCNSHQPSPFHKCIKTIIFLLSNHIKITEILPNLSVNLFILNVDLSGSIIIFLLKTILIFRTVKHIKTSFI